MKTRILLVLLLLALVPTAARAQAQGGDPGQRIEAALQRAAATGIPASLLRSKVAEGQAKGYPLSRVATGVERRLELLSRARDVMGGAAATASDLSVGADALAAGVDGDALRTLARTAPADRRAVAIAVLAQLVQQGHGSERALERVQLALAEGPEALRRLPALEGAPGRERSRFAGQTERGGGPPKAIPDPARGRAMVEGSEQPQPAGLQGKPKGRP